MIIVLTPENTIQNEQECINHLFEIGIDLLHIRKFWMNDAEMSSYIEGINHPYRERLVLHSHFHLAERIGIKRLHFREDDRKQNKHEAFVDNNIISTSVHSIKDFNALDKKWTYAFLSPVFPSISKQGYGVEKNVLNDLSQKNNLTVKLIGLGGIDSHNYHKVYEAGADGIALLGAVWNGSMSDENLSKIIQYQTKL